MSQRQKRSGAAHVNEGRREREFLRYAGSLNGICLLDKDVAVSSQDVALTAYAQLAALRMNAKRATISLFDSKNQYIIAEATRTLSLQSDTTHDHTDGLVWGVTSVPREAGICNSTLMAQKVGAASPVLYNVPDLTANDAYARHPSVTGKPFLRSYVAAPLITPKGLPIGTVAVLDDVVRSRSLTDAEHTFLHDLATTIMNHLELARRSTAHNRGVQMVKGLSRFIEGQDSLRDTGQQAKLDVGAPSRIGNLVFPSTGQAEPESERSTVPQMVGLFASDRTRALNAASNAERVDVSYDPAKFIPDSKNRHGSNPIAVSGGEAYLSSRRPLANNAEVAESQGQTQAGANRPPKHVPRSRSVSFNDKSPPALDDSQQTFQRAATILRQSMDVSGVLFLDGSVVTQGSLHQGQKSSTSSEDSSSASFSSKSGHERVQREQASHTANTEEQNSPSLVLGSSYEGFRSEQSHVSVTEKILKSLMRKFPYGKIWNFDEAGVVSSDEMSDSSSTVSSYESPQPPVEGKKSSMTDTKMHRNRRARQSDSSLIYELFPGVRSLALMPLWDAAHQRFSAASLVWTNHASRVLTFHDDINYLGAFCDAVMAETGRLDAQADVRGKTAFIRSISHELRSPLHGILGSVECLQENPNDLLKDDMLQMIETCGRSLLDIFDHLLDHVQTASVRKAVNPMKSIGNAGRLHSSTRKARKKHFESTLPERQCDLAALTEEICDAVLWSTPKDFPHLGSLDQARPFRLDAEPPLKIILEVDSTLAGPNGWYYQIEAGAWRRLVLNLVTNAIKYTDAGGFVAINLSIEKPSSVNDQLVYDVVKLTCSDSGRGMSQQYLDNGLWKAFSQEDSQTQGTGLGLNIVHAIVKVAKGSISVNSAQGTGTNITVTLPLSRTQIPRSTSGNGISIPCLRQRLQATTFQLIGFDNVSDIGSRSSQATAMLRASIESAFENFGMRLWNESVTDNPESAKMFVISEARAILMDETEASAMLSFPCIVLCHSTASARQLLNSGACCLPMASYVSQPLGPLKLSRVLSRYVQEVGTLQSSCSTKSFIYNLPRESSNLPSRSARVSSSTSPKAENPESDDLAQHTTPSKNGASNLSDILISRSDVTAVSNSNRTLDEDLIAQSLLTSTSSWLVLLVDDNEINLRLLVTYMNKAGYRHVSAMNGLEALETYKTTIQNFRTLSEVRQPSTRSTTLPWVILMDITMPVMDGLESTRLIRAHERALGLKPAVIIALTALFGVEARQEAYASGVDLFLTKPIKFKELLAIFDDLDLGHRKESADMRGPM